MIDPNKSIVIFSHPRSGSTWFQNSLHQYSLGELFNLNIEVSTHEDNIHHRFIKHGYDVNTMKEELKKRFSLYEYFESIKTSVSVKIHGTILNPQIIEFLKEKKLQSVLLERRSKFDTFWSLLIGWTINNWHDDILPQEISVKLNTFNRVMSIMNGIEYSFDLINSNFSPTKIYYEDLLDMPDNDWFVSTKKFKILNGKNIVMLTNLEEVNQWLIDAGKNIWIQT